ncbi:hypothetical protein FRC07_000609, partial [Ceratobasidium sp. 392]
GPSQQQPDYGQQQYDHRRSAPAPYPSQLPPLQVNPSTYHQSEPPRNLPSSSLPPVSGQPHTRNDRHRTQSVALTSIGQREQRSYASSSAYGRIPPNYPPAEATVPISRSRQHQQQPQQQQWVQYPSEGGMSEPAQVPYISSVMSPYAHPHVPSRVMPPLSELDRRIHPVQEEPSQPRPKPHVCDQCAAAFSRAHDLKRHIETHKGDRPHKCPTCTKAFSRKDALQRHQSMAQCGVDGQDPNY